MTVTCAWIISSLVLLICGFTIAGGLVTYCNRNNTWSDISKRCQLASKEDINEINNTNVGWIGGLYRTTSWMSHEGCYFNPGNGSNHQTFPDNSPPKCSVLCDKYQFFALMVKGCICIERIDFSSITGDTRLCSEPCPGFYSTNCGNTVNKYADLYRHLKTDINIRNNTDPSFHCLAVKNKTNKLKLEAVSCSRNFNPLCVDPSTKKILSRMHNAVKNQGIPFKEAKDYCHLYDNTLITSIPQWGTHWTAYHRYEYLYWLNDDNDLVIHQGEGHSKTKCLAIQKSKDGFTRLARKCSDKLPFFCSDRNTSSHDIDRNICQNDGQYDDSVSTITNAIVTTEKTTTSPSTHTETETTPVDVTLDQITTVYTEVIHETSTVYSIPGINGTEVINRTSTVNSATENNATVPHTNVFAIQIVFVVCLSVGVAFVAALSWLMYRTNSESTELPASPKLERIYFNDVNDFDITTPPINCTNEYCSAWDIYHHTTESSPKHSCITTLTGTKIDNSVDNEYHHIDFTLKSDADQTFIDQNEYGITGSQTTGEVYYERPLKNSTQRSQRSQINKLLNNIRKVPYAVRNSFLKQDFEIPTSSTTDGGAYMDIELNHTKFLYDTPHT